MQLKKLLPTAALAIGAAAQQMNLTAALAANNATLSLLTGLLGTQPSLVSTLAGLSNITILAPSNNALAAFLNSTAGVAASKNPDAVAALLTYHVLNGTYPASAFTNSSQFIPTLLTNTSFANVTGGQRVEASLNGSTVDIFSGLLSKSQVTQANINFTGGIIHVIDKILTLPESDAATAIAANLTSLAGALTATNLVSTVDGLSDVTIFAPDNAAFAAIGSAVGNLTTAQLSGILTYHVVKGTVGYSSLLSNTTLTTVNGATVRITIENGQVFVNSARVVTPDVLVANGVVHVIDGVLNPNNTAATPNPTTTTVAFSGASSASGTPFTSGVTQSTTILSTHAASSSSSSAFAGHVHAMPTGAVGMGALFGGAALVMANL